MPQTTGQDQYTIQKGHGNNSVHQPLSLDKISHSFSIITFQFMTQKEQDYQFVCINMIHFDARTWK